MTNRFLIIYPIDATTDFLESIIVHLYAHSHIYNWEIELLRVDFNMESHNEALEKIRKEDKGVILFLGHGNSQSLHGAKNENYSNTAFVNLNNVDVFSGKNMMLLSCNSSDLLKKYRMFNRSIGFGDLPTDWNDVSSAREFDSAMYQDFTEETIDVFKKEIVEVVKLSLIDFISSPNDLRYLFDILRLRLNKKIAEYYFQKNKLGQSLSRLFFQVKKELFFGQSF